MGSEVRSPGKFMIVQTDEQLFKADQLIEIPIYLRSEEAIQGYQFTFGFDISSWSLWSSLLCNLK
jgi:hypothetical protein